MKRRSSHLAYCCVDIFDQALVCGRVRFTWTYFCCFHPGVTRILDIAKTNRYTKQCSGQCEVDTLVDITRWTESDFTVDRTDI